MSRLTKQMVIKQLLDASTITTPTLDYYFKRVNVSIFKKEEMDKARRKLNK